MSPANSFSVSVPDSKRFGIRVVRGLVDPKQPLADFISDVDEAAADLLILRVPAGDTRHIAELCRHGHQPIHADTLVYYGIDLSAESGRIDASTDVRRAIEDDKIRIHEIAEASFRGYRSHYSANPLLPQDEVLRGYIEWAKSRLDDSDPNQATWVARRDDVAAGFATCDLRRDSGAVEIILNAVHPDHARRGIYTALLQNLIHNYANQKFSRLSISTQIWNYTVQRQWMRAGLLIERAFDTYHIDRRISEG